jgi:aspartyl protease family protein
MSVLFDPNDELVIIPVEAIGPKDTYVLRLALDTGATGTVINASLLTSLGYDLTQAPEQLQMTTGSAVSLVPRLPVQKLSALGQERIDFQVVAHTLPVSAAIDGLLGLDFLRGHTLTLDFANGLITLV